MTTTQASAPAQLPHFSLVIDGQLTEPASGRSYESIDPFSGAPWATAADGGEADVNRAVPANGKTRSPLSEARRNGHGAVVDYLKSRGARG